MPIYEYRCVPNQHRFERLQTLGDPPPPCPICGGETVRVFTPVGVIFRGAGFHATDYRRGSPDGARAGGAASDPPKADTPGADGSKTGGSTTDATAPKPESRSTPES